jgi:transposase
MDIILDRCAGLDVHKKTLVACIRRTGPDGAVDSQVRTFSTMTADLLALSDGLEAAGVRHVALESTGVYWKPVFNLLEGRFEVMLVNPGRIKQVPGRQTDVKAAEWIAPLLQYGRLSPSFIPAPAIRALRELTRQRAELVRDQTAVAHRIPKVLEDAHIKLGVVASDVLGVSGRAMIGAIIAGQDDPERLAERAKGSLRGQIPELKRALHGRVTEPHRFLLGALMDPIEAREGLIARSEARIDAAMEPYAAAAARLRGIPGVGARGAAVIVAELGPDLSAFPTAGHLSSWAGLCPGNNQSAGKRRTGKTTKGSQWLRTLRVPVAWAASPTKETVFSAGSQRWVKRLGKKKALVALAHQILVVIGHLWKDGTAYRERSQPAPAVGDGSEVARGGNEEKGGVFAAGRGRWGMEAGPAGPAGAEWPGQGACAPADRGAPRRRSQTLPATRRCHPAIFRGTLPIGR